MSFDDDERTTLLRSLRGYAERMGHLGVQGISEQEKGPDDWVKKSKRAEHLQADRQALGSIGAVSLDGRTSRCWVVMETANTDGENFDFPINGEAREMFDKMIAHVLGLKSSQVRVVNEVRALPVLESHRTEVGRPSKLHDEISRGKPDLILAMGGLALQSLVQSKSPISSARGKWMDILGVPMLATFHPKYLLRAPGQKRLVFQDLQAFKKRMDNL